MTRRLLYVISRGLRAGAQTHVSDLVAGLAMEQESLVAVGEDGFLADRIRDLGARAEVIPGLLPHSGVGSSAIALRSLHSLIAGFKPQAVHSHSFKSGLMGRLAARKMGVPSVFTAHGWIFNPGVPPHRRIPGRLLERAAARVTDRIITVCESDLQLASVAGIAEQKLTCIPNGVRRLPTAKPRRNGDELRIAMVARLDSPKDHVTVLEAAADLEFAYKLLFIGDGPRRPELERLAHQLDVADRVQFMGHRDDVDEIIAGVDVLALMSHWEGLPLCVLEAMSAGIPVVASNVGGLAEAVVDGQTGYLVREGDSQGLVGALSKLANDSDLRVGLGAAGRQRYSERYRVEQMVERTRDVYNALLGP